MKYPVMIIIATERGKENTKGMAYTESTRPDIYSKNCPMRATGKRNSAPLKKYVPRCFMSLLYTDTSAHDTIEKCYIHHYI
jgi:hypothetical protein